MDAFELVVGICGVFGCHGAKFKKILELSLFPYVEEGSGRVLHRIFGPILIKFHFLCFLTESGTNIRRESKKLIY